MGTKNNPGPFDCYSKADPDEPMFVLLGRDPLAPFLVSLWASLRQQLRDEDDPKAAEANLCAESMVSYLTSIGKTPFMPSVPVHIVEDKSALQDVNPLGLDSYEDVYPSLIDED